MKKKTVTPRQQIIKWVYPLFMRLKKAKGEPKKLKNRNVSSVASFYDLAVLLNDGTSLAFNTLKGKKVLLVNTASDCGYTNQYSELQALYERRKDKLIVIGFPANDFKKQEKGSDAEIAQFCKVNFGVSFPLAKKSTVIKSGGQNKVFEWLTDKELNGWNDQQPSWNFAKYLVNEEGMLSHYFDPAVSPLSPELTNEI